MHDFLSRVYFGNSILNYIISLVIIIVTIILIRIFKLIFLSKFKKWATKTKTSFDDFIIQNIEKFVLPLLYFGAVFAGLNYLTLNLSTHKIINSAIIIIMTFFGIRFIAVFLNYFIKYYWQKRHGGQADVNIKGISTFISLVVWGLGLVFLLDNLGFKISAVVAGLGIGGIAVALAAQTVLGDLFSYFVIFFDRPFQIGDFIIVDDYMGTVEKVGIKTTRVASLSGEQLVFANSDLTHSRLHNYKKMLKRRVLFRIGVVYQTPYDKLKEIPALIKNIIVSIEATTFDRAHFQSYGDFSIIFEIVYYVIGPDYNKYMDIQQEINLRLYEEFEKRGIEFAFPTQTLYLNRSDNNIKSEVVKLMTNNGNL